MCSSKCFAKPKISIQDILTSRGEFGESKKLEIVEVAGMKILKDDLDFLKSIFTGLDKEEGI